VNEEAKPMRISIVITNYNFGHYIGEAIQSALNVRWPDKEIIVCDDGSTDNSREVIEGFCDAVKVVYKANGGQPSAANLAFPLATGEIIFFLDSDDILLPSVAEVVVEAWDANTTKIQFPLIVIDQTGADTGRSWPNFGHTLRPELIKAELMRTGRYPTSCTSGNAFSKKFLRELFPVPEDLVGLDSYLCMTAPLYGNVKTITRPLGQFRIHGANSWSQLAWQPEKLGFYIDQEIRRDAFVHRWAEKLGLEINPNSLRMDHGHLMNRLAYQRNFPRASRFPKEPVGILIRDGIRAALLDPFVNRKTKLVIALWLLVVGLSPRRIALWAIRARHVPLSRPRILQSVLFLAGAVRRQTNPLATRLHGDVEAP
jgi:glycosyltransferase involved in cell wall biosynthesis